MNLTWRFHTRCRFGSAGASVSGEREGPAIQAMPDGCDA